MGSQASATMVLTCTDDQSRNRRFGLLLPLAVRLIRRSRKSARRWKATPLAGLHPRARATSRVEMPL